MRTLFDGKSTGLVLPARYQIAFTLSERLEKKAGAATAAIEKAAVELQSIGEEIKVLRQLEAYADLQWIKNSCLLFREAVR